MAAKAIAGVTRTIDRRVTARKETNVARQKADQHKFLLEYVETVTAQTADGAAPAPTRMTLSARSLVDNGTILRIPAGASATLRVTQIGGWHYDHAALSIAPYGRNMALPLRLERNTPGPAGFDAALTLAPSPPLFIGALVVGYNAYAKGAADVISDDVLDLEVEGSTTTIPMNLGTRHAEGSTRQEFIGGVVSKVTLKQQVAHTRTPRITAILRNSGEGLSVAQGDDRVLHSVPRRLRDGDHAQSRDLAEYMNAQASAGEDMAVFRIGARSDCCIRLRLDMTRRRVAGGVLGAPLDGPLALSPWRAQTLTPDLPDGTGVTCTFTARARPSGPARIGLLRPETPLSARQGVSLLPRVSYLQPFRLPRAGSSPRRLEGLWLCLSAPPNETETLVADITSYESRTAMPGAPRASGKAEISTRVMDLTDIGNGLFVHWVAFDHPLDIDTPDLTATFALVLRDTSGRIPLVEAAAGRAPALLPALFRDFARSDHWIQRRFGHAAKVLMFELGETRDTATVTLQAGAQRSHVTVPESGAEISLQVPGAATLVLSADRDVVLDGPRLESRSAQSG